MDPFTLALATFGVQKLRGKSTKRALRDAAIVGGGSYAFSQAAGAGMIPGVQQGVGIGKIGNWAGFFWYKFFIRYSTNVKRSSHSTIR